MFFVLWFGGHALALAAVPLLVHLLVRPNRVVLTAGAVGALLSTLVLAYISAVHDFRPGGLYHWLSWVVAAMAGFGGVGLPVCLLQWIDREVTGTAPHRRA